MAVYHQMGYQSSNLVDLPEMSGYTGAIYSPINSTQGEMVRDMKQSRESRGVDFENVFDPQLYVPATARDQLRKWSYFPKDVDTADPTSVPWWNNLTRKLSEVCLSLKANAVCSPVVIPKIFEDAYYERTVRVASDLVRQLKGRDVRVLQTVLVSLSELSSETRALQVASIVSATAADRIYLVFVGTEQPRRELRAGEELLGAMQLVNALERNGMPVVVGFCSSDVIMWKAAGATACASGKFFNLRRFTRQRFEEPMATGGGQLPYWFEENLLAFLRQGDLVRVRKQSLLSEASKGNPFCTQILKLMDEAAQVRTKPVWLGISWRQFLFWFADVEARLNSGKVRTRDLLETADKNWSKLDDAGVLPEERQNDGNWIRVWLNTLNDFGKNRSRRSTTSAAETE